MSIWTFRILELALFVPAIVIHEVSHGYVSYLLGDPTAKMRGRLSLNPVKHIDPFGTVLLPLLLAVSGAPVFGYAKPVPINPNYYKDYRKGMLLSGLAGPTSNLAMAIVSSLAVRLLGGTATMNAGGVAGTIAFALFYFAMINLVLMFFNLIPIPPLDGSRVLPIFLSDRALQSYHRFERYGILIFFVVVLLLPDILGFSPVNAYFRVTVDPVLQFLSGVSFGG